MNIMLNLLKKNCSAVACQCTCVPSTKKNVCVVCAPSLVWQWPVGALFRWLTSWCCPLQLFRVVGSHVLLVSCPPKHHSRKERWAAVSFHMFPQPREVCPRIDNDEISGFNFKRNNTPACSAICRSLALGLLPSGHNGLLIQMLICFSSGCYLFRLSLRKGGSPYSPGFVPAWCLPEQESLESDEPPGSLLPLLRRVFNLERPAAICIRCWCLTRQRVHHFFHW